MAFSTDYYNIYRKILNTDDYLDYLRINDEIEYATKLTEEEREKLRKKYAELLDTRFLHPDCNSIEEIRVPYKDGDYTRYGIEKAQQKCVFANDLGMTLADYMLRIENNRDFSIKVNFRRTTANAQEVIKRLNRKTSVLNNEQALGNIDEETMLKEMELNIDEAKASSVKIDELSENIKDLRLMVTKLQNQIRELIQRNSELVKAQKPNTEQKATTTKLIPIQREEGRPKVFEFAPKKVQRNVSSNPQTPPPEPIAKPIDYVEMFQQLPRHELYFLLVFSIFVNKDKTILRKSKILPAVMEHIVTENELQRLYEHREDFGFPADMLKLKPENPIQVAVYSKYVLGETITPDNRVKYTNAFKDFVEGWKYGK